MDEKEDSIRTEVDLDVQRTASSYLGKLRKWKSLSRLLPSTVFNLFSLWRGNGESL